MSELKTLFAQIEKSDRQEDGSLLVRGRISDETLDVDQQIADKTWLAKAIPAWFTWGNIREMHGAIAAGVATEHTEKDGGHDIVARIVNPSSVAKIEAGVLKGFSIGIRGARVTMDKAAPGGRIMDGQIVEVSLVDRPANPSCTLTLAKSATPGTQVNGDDYDSTTNLIKVEALTEATPAPEPAPAPDLAELVKAAVAEALAATITVPELPAPEVEKATEPDTVKSAVAEALNPLIELVQGLSARLEKVEGTPIPGGPARTGTASDAVSSAKADGLRAEIETLKATRATVIDRALGDAYDSRIAEKSAALAQLSTLHGRI